MLQNIEIHHFQNLNIHNENILNQALTKEKEIKEDRYSIVFIQDPYLYFDYLLFDYLKEKKSILFTQDIINNMKKMSAENFLTWFSTLHFTPLQNPQTFQLDISSRVETAMNNLERYDYVVPCNKIDTFLNNVSLNRKIEKKKFPALLFSLSKQKKHPLIENFIGKDLTLYKKSCELWEQIEKSHFKPLREIIEHKKKKKTASSQNSRSDYNGVVGIVTAQTIRGWVFHKKKKATIVVGIYKNNTFLHMAKANLLREDLKKQDLHPTGKCGFEVNFDKATFQAGDNIEVQILPDKIPLPLGKNVKEFLEG